MPSIEEVDLEMSYAFSCNPGDSYQGFEQTGSDRIEHFQKHFEPTLMMLNQYAILDLHMEISKKGRLHYHGWLTFRSETLLLFYLKFVHALMKRCTFTLVVVDWDKDPKGSKWKEYITKQTAWFKPYRWRSPKDKSPFGIDNKTKCMILDVPKEIKKKGRPKKVPEALSNSYDSKLPNHGPGNLGYNLLEGEPE